MLLSVDLPSKLSRGPSYYAHTALRSIHRSLAVQEWSRFQGTEQSFENLGRALGAFDMFVLHDEEEDMDDVCASWPPASCVESR